jgi:hypothetical protein
VTANVWNDRAGASPDPFSDNDESTGYRAWRAAKGGVRDLKFVPAPSSGELVRFEPYLQAISLELNADATALCMMCHTSGQIIFIEGRGLDDLADQISARRAGSVHVWSEDAGTAPPVVVTSLRFDKTASELSRPE